MFSNLETVLKELGNILVMLGVLMFSLLVVAYFFGKLYVIIKPLLLTAFIAIAFGSLLRYSFRHAKEPEFKHAMVCVALVWLVIPALSSLLFILIEYMSPLDSFFEAMSGWTGTGLTMIAHPFSLTHTMQFWRSLMQWVGGVGVIVLMLSILAHPGTGTFALYKAEARVEKIKPSVISTVRMTWWIYLILTSFGILLFFFAGMKPWEAINHAMTAIGTGCFTITDKSMSAYNNFLIELAVIPMMILGALPFLVHYKVLKGNFKAFFKDMQCRAFVVILFILLVSLFALNYSLYGNVFSCLRYSSFQLISGLTCTGFQTTSVYEWSGAGLLIVCMSMIIGGGAGSTAGGVKLIRAVIAYKWIGWSLRKNFLPPRALKPLRFGDRVLEREEVVKIVADTSLIIILWLLFLFLGICVLSLVVGSQFQLGDVIFEVASAQGNVGLSTGITNAGMSCIGKLMLILNMWIGRLEIIPVLMLLRVLVKGFEPI
ncbi:MAG: TrkH family potassium uptake protein [Methanophagales archaeon]|nr:TrkH family potassium uptake protein [Methanophagales archaeon]